MIIHLNVHMNVINTLMQDVDCVYLREYSYECSIVFFTNLSPFLDNHHPLVFDNSYCSNARYKRNSLPGAADIAVHWRQPVTGKILTNPSLKNLFYKSYISSRDSINVVFETCIDVTTLPEYNSDYLSTYVTVRKLPLYFILFFFWFLILQFFCI